MDHIRQFDWCLSEPEGAPFIDAKDMENSVIEKILANRFHDPLISDSDDDDPADVMERAKIDWSKIFVKRVEMPKKYQFFAAGFKKPPFYPKLSSLTAEQHRSLMKIICAENPDILFLKPYPRPNKSDHKAFEELKDTYLKEQKEFLAWAKTLWASKHCLNALRPKPTVETVYEAEFKMRAAEMGSYPKNYEMAAQISLLNARNKCDMVFKQDLITVHLNNIPKVEVPLLSVHKFPVLRPCPLPQPCDKHPCWFVLPNEKSTTVLPLTEIHTELAQYALDNGARCIASEGALKCLLETDRHWLLPLTVSLCVNDDCERENVLVFGSEFSTRKASPMSRTYSAYRHLLEHSLIPPEEKTRILKRLNGDEKSENGSKDQSKLIKDILTSDEEDNDKLVINEEPVFHFGNINKLPVQSDSEGENDLIIDETRSETSGGNEKTPQSPKRSIRRTSYEENKNKPKTNDIKSPENKKNEFYNCNCMDSSFERPPQRSFRRWQLRNFADSNNLDNIDLIVHCAHRMKCSSGEVIVEPIPEYQIDLGGSKQSDEKIRSLALSLFLRKNATLLNVRIDCTTGDMVTVEKMSKDDFMSKHMNIMHSVANVLYESISQLQGLVPGQYILQHEPGHGTNALLFATRGMGSGEKLNLDFNIDILAEADEGKSVKDPPVLAPVLLPIHKLRDILPLAFTPDPKMVAREIKKPAGPQSKPPRALRWPKGRNKKIYRKRK